MRRGLKLTGLFAGTILVAAIGVGAADTQPPTVQIETPQDGANYLLNEPVEVAWTVDDAFPGSGLKTVLATQPNGARLDTNIAGEHVFVVTAEDHAGNQTQRQVRYWVVYDVTMEKPLAPSAFEDEAPPEMTVDVGTEIPFRFQVLDFFEQPVNDASGTLSVLDAETREIVFFGDDGVGVLQFNSETETYDFSLDTASLSADDYQVLIQFNDGRTIFRIDLTLEGSGSA